MWGKRIKQLLVFSGLDKPVAAAAHRLHSPLIKRLIPGPEYYGAQLRTIRRHGVRFRVKPSDLSQWFMFADHNDDHVQAATGTISGDNPGVILDIGANIGHFSLLMATKIRGGGRKILAFEPNPAVYAMLRQNISLNPSLHGIVETHNFGLGKDDATLNLSMPRRNSGAGTLLHDYDNEPHDTYEVKIKRLDDVVREPVAFIKLDVEGFECQVLTGGSGLLNKYHPPVYFESGSQQPGQRDVFTLLASYGYSFFYNGSRIEPDEKTLRGMSGIANVLAVY